jgi:hypothetical protein
MYIHAHVHKTHHMPHLSESLFLLWDCWFWEGLATEKEKRKKTYIPPHDVPTFHVCTHMCDIRPCVWKSTKNRNTFCYTHMHLCTHNLLFYIAARCDIVVILPPCELFLIKIFFFPKKITRQRCQNCQHHITCQEVIPAFKLSLSGLTFLDQDTYVSNSKSLII